MHAVADFCLIPMGIGEVGVTKVDGTGVQGEFGQVMKVIEECHQAVHAMGCPRVATDIRIGTRTDKQGSLDNKVSSVQQLLIKDEAKKE
ncbi:BZ3500_MvSof-1268-A1-R1_Chr4-2g06962 [Microbotryum saponariae]|uniref:BZ3500_MvSof-1268-A1-R1_Chr4-2g06962 protein n=1 Tax=Microbotryum saponariae TaxID=289078 RepID=A0A2X0KXA4_9BASI|nr:BZ3500_MvSof-1268-A1-R1_Chr4-2g06962 [Microbotryum saponariae]SDA06627.1 BZ3501_MvSof-1269-A2-R1_Chr4-2g06673 [Microbotryum saponariae]